MIQRSTDVAAMRTKAMVDCWLAAGIRLGSASSGCGVRLGTASQSMRREFSSANK